MNQPTTVDFDKAVGMTSTQVHQKRFLFFSLFSSLSLLHIRISLWLQHNLTVESWFHWNLLSSKTCRIFSYSWGGSKMRKWNQFRHLDNLRDNQEGEEVTVVDQLHIIGKCENQHCALMSFTSPLSLLQPQTFKFWLAHEEHFLHYRRASFRASCGGSRAFSFCSWRIYSFLK